MASEQDPSEVGSLAPLTGDVEEAVSNAPRGSPVRRTAIGSLAALVTLGLMIGLGYKAGEALTDQSSTPQGLNSDSFEYDGALCKTYCTRMKNKAWDEICAIKRRGVLQCGGCDECKGGASAPAPKPAQALTPLATTSTSYTVEGKTSCGWGSGCTDESQSFICPTSTAGCDEYGIKGGMSKVMGGVAENDALEVCGPICDGDKDCAGFNWIAELHGVVNGCWFRMKPDCAKKPKKDRICYTKR